MAAQVAQIASPYPPGFPSGLVVAGAANIKLFVPGKPVPKGRPRGRAVSPKSGGKPFIQFYTDEQTVGWEGWVASQVMQQLMSIEFAGETDVPLPFTQRVLISMRFNFEKPKSTPKSVLYPVKSRTDVDNLAKAVMDALQNAHVLSNDNIVTDLTVTKRYVDDLHPEGVEIDISGLLY